LEPGANLTTLFSIVNAHLISSFSGEIGHFIWDTILFICYEHSSLTARIGKKESKQSLIGLAPGFWYLPDSVFGDISTECVTDLD